MTLIGIHVDIRCAVQCLRYVLCVSEARPGPSRKSRAGPLTAWCSSVRSALAAIRNLEDAACTSGWGIYQNCIKCGFQPANYWIRKVGTVESIFGASHRRAWQPGVPGRGL